MKSKVQIKGHPLHPILVSFPIAFFIGTFALDIASVTYEKNEFRNMAGFLEGAGICFALLAAVPGFLDYLFTVPPDSSGKKRAAKHGIINVTMVVIFFIAWMIRQESHSSMAAIITLEAAGVIMLGVAGWMGGTLVYRNQIGVDHRYAHAGKWNEAKVETVNGKAEVAAIGELKVNQIKLVHVANLRIAVCRTEKGYAAFDDRCSHRGASLADGAMICETVQCPWHGSQFDVNTGSVKAGPAKDSIKTYPVTESGRKIFITISR